MIALQTAVSNAFSIHHPAILSMCEVHLRYAMTQDAKASRRRVLTLNVGCDTTINQPHPVTIFGKTYPSVKSAARDLGINADTLFRNLEQPDLDEWAYQHLQKKRSPLK